MKMFGGTIGRMKRLLRLPVQRNVPATHEDTAANDEPVMIQIARACPDLIVLASELRLRVMQGEERMEGKPKNRIGFGRVFAALVSAVV